MKKLLSALFITFVLTISVCAQAQWVGIDGANFGPVCFDDATGTLVKVDPAVTIAYIPSDIYGVPVTAVGTDCFVGCEGLWRVYLPDTVTQLGQSVFSGCGSLQEVTLPDGITALPAFCFSFCTQLETIDLPDAITSMGSYVFSNCPGLKTVDLPDSLTELGYNTFNDCANLTTISIPVAVAAIGDQAVSDCPHFAHVCYAGTEEQWAEIAISPTSGLENATIHYETAEITPYPSDWAAADVEAAADVGLLPPFAGNPDYTDAMTRLQFAQLIVNFVELTTGADIVPAEESTFGDCVSESVLKAYACGIVGGYGNGMFVPDIATNREQIATMIHRAITYVESQTGEDLAPLTGDLSAFSDADTVSDFAQEAVAILSANGIMNGTTQTTLSPQSTCTVEMGVVLVGRLLHLA